MRYRLFTGQFSLRVKSVAMEKTASKIISNNGTPLLLDFGFILYYEVGHCSSIQGEAHPNAIFVSQWNGGARETDETTHAGTLGWITLGFLAACLWLFSAD